MFNRKEYARKYYFQHRLKMIERTQKDRLQDIKKYKEQYQKYNLQHREKSKQYYLQHKEEIIKRGHSYYLQHKEKIKEYRDKYRIQHKKEKNDYERERLHKKGIHIKYYRGISLIPGYKKMQKARYRDRIKKAGKLTLATIQEVYDDNILANGGVLKCIYCNKELVLKEATLEHKQPLSREGTNDKENLAIACLSCNSSKHDKTEEEFRKIIGCEISKLLDIV